MNEISGPMGLANQEIRDAIDEFQLERLESRRLPSLLARTDAMLTELETLNLIGAKRAPASWRQEVTTLVAELPFQYAPRMGQRPSPTAAIGLVFDIQAGLFHLMTGAEPDDGAWTS
jgi:hypothetical protein